MENKLQATIKYLIDSKVTDITPKKLQKMLYYCYSWHLVLTAEDDSEDELSSSKLFNADIEAWVHGPVIAEVYEKYKKNKYSEITDSDIDIEVKDFLNDDEIDSIDQVIEAYGHLNGHPLEQLTHSETPWIKARGECKPLDICKNKIEDKEIYNFYVSKLE